MLDGGDEGNVLEVDAPGCEVVVRGLTFEHGHASGGGLVRFTAGRLVLENCVFAHGTAKAFGGGALLASGQSLQVRRSVFLENVGRQGGAVLLDELVDAVFVDCLFARNAAVQGGALRLREGVTARLVGCTFAHNRCVPNPEVTSPAAGASFFVSGSTTRTPSLALENGLFATFPGALAAEGFNDPQVPGTVSVRHSVLPAVMPGMSDTSCAVHEVRFAAGDWAPQKGSAPAVASRAVYEQVGSVDLAGAARGTTPGALNER